MATRKRIVEAARKRRSPELNSVRVLVLPDEEHVPDEDPDFVAPLDRADFENRKQAFQRGDFSFVGVVAKAEIVVDGIVQTITSGGLWGIESDSDKTYIAEVADDEYGDLRRILKTLGVPTSELPMKVDPKWIEWRV